MTFLLTLQAIGLLAVPSPALQTVSYRNPFILPAHAQASNGSGVESDTSAVIQFLAELGATQPVLQGNIGITFRPWNDHSKGFPWERAPGYLKASETIQAQTKTAAGILTALDELREWWKALTDDQRRQAICRDRFPSLILAALEPLVKGGWMLPNIERYLAQVTDTSVLSTSAFVDALKKHSDVAQSIAMAAKGMGNSHRYDVTIAKENGGYKVDSDGWFERQARALLLLSRVYLATGRIQRAMQTLTAARAMDPLADPWFAAYLSLQLGDTLQAIRELAFCRVITWPCMKDQFDDTTSLTQMESLYRTVNRGTVNGLDSLVAAARHHQGIAIPDTMIRRFSPRSNMPGRFVLVQYTTESGCPPCAAHDGAVPALDTQFGEHVIVLAYHYANMLGYNGMGIREPLWLRREATRMQDTSWRPQSMVNGIHQYCIDMWVDGRCVRAPAQVGGRIGMLMTYDYTAAAVEARLRKAPTVRMDVRAQRVGDRVTAIATVTSVETVPKAARLKLQMVLVEDSIPLAGLNSPMQNHVVRQVVGDSTNGFGVTLSLHRLAQHVTATFDIAQIEASTRAEAAKDGFDYYREQPFMVLDRRHLFIVTFVQDQLTGDVLQVARVPVRVSDSPTH